MSGVADGVRTDLATFADSGGGLGAAALVLAGLLDDPEVPAAAKASCARALQGCLDRLRELEPEESDRGGVDELASRRSARRAAS